MTNLNSLKAGLAVWLALAGAAQAASVSDSLTVTITPNAFYAVSIATTAVNLNLGLVDLAASTQTVSPATVTVQSSYAATDLKLQGSIAGGWSFDADTASQEQDSLASWGVFTDTSVPAAPAQGAGGAFSGTVPGADDTDVISAASQDVGDVTAGVQRRFVRTSGSTGYKTMEDLPPSSVDLAASRSHLWLYFRLPNATSVTAAQNITVTLTAGAPN